MRESKKAKEERLWREQCKARRALALQSLWATEDVEPDVPPPSPSEMGSRLTVGWSPCGSRVEPSCSSSMFHARGYVNKTTSQRPIYLYSTRLRALKALRRATEYECGERLRTIDDMIAAETAKPTPLPKQDKEARR